MDERFHLPSANTQGDETNPPGQARLTWPCPLPTPLVCLYSVCHNDAACLSGR